MSPVLDDLTALYEDSKACARLVGLSYIEDESFGITRLKRGKGFSYQDHEQRIVADKKMKQRIAELVIPPAWQEVWICPYDNGHILATGIDEKGRKQYIYNPKWRTMRDLIKFYRMIIFGHALPKIRHAINTDLSERGLSRNKVIGVMLWMLDNTYLRIGHDEYFTENESVGLTTLSDKNLIIAGPVITLSFRGKSGKDQQITFENAQVAGIIEELIRFRGARLFRYKDGNRYVNIEAAHINAYLQEITHAQISAKDFRTWGGTLMAYNHLVETYKKPAARTPKPDKVVIEAVDAAANVLGNTRTVAKSSYVHPDILQTYSEKHFNDYYETARRQSDIDGLDKRESELLRILEALFEKEFDLLKA